MIGVHVTHCCVLHGCKYCDKDCPVYTRKVKQAYTCEDCSMEGINAIPDPDSQDWDDQNDVLAMDRRELIQEVLMLRGIIKDANIVM